MNPSCPGATFIPELKQIFEMCSMSIEEKCELSPLSEWDVSVLQDPYVRVSVLNVVLVVQNTQNLHLQRRTVR